MTSATMLTGLAIVMGPLAACFAWLGATQRMMRVYERRYGRQ